MDIAYVKIKASYLRWTYLCIVKDLYNQEIVAYDVWQSQNIAQIYRILEQVLYLPLVENTSLHTDSRLSIYK